MIPDLAQSLSGHDLGFLQIIAELWGVELQAAEFKPALEELIPSLLDPDLLGETLEILPHTSRVALADLQENGGLLAWPTFARRYGEVRQMGRGRRERELPYRSPDSTAEVLFYRALVGRAFFDTPDGPQEFAYIPSDTDSLLADLVLPAVGPQGPAAPGRRARPEDRSDIFPATDELVDHACTLLAGLRLGLDGGWLGRHLPLPVEPLQELLAAAGLLDELGQPLPEQTGNFLKMKRAESLAVLFQAWRRSQDYRELAHVPHLLLEGEWEYDPRRGREAILSFVGRTPADTWWNLDSFIDSIHQENPDFQRPAGDYDSWYIRHQDAGHYLRGFEHWEEVDGAYLRYMLTGPLHWFGLLDLAVGEATNFYTAFRLSPMAPSLLADQPPADLSAEAGTVTVRSNGTVAVSHLAPRVIRYQVARFCQWDSLKGGTYHYRLTGRSLERAREQGFRAGPILGLLTKAAETIPPNIARALDYWDRQGAAGQVEQATILRLVNPEVLNELRKSRASRFLGDPLSPTTVIVKPGAETKVLELLTELGYFGLED